MPIRERVASLLAELPDAPQYPSQGATIFIDLERREIGFCIENQPIDTARKRLFNQKEWFDATVFIGPGVAEFSPAFVCVLQVQADRYTAGGRASRDVEYVR